MTQNPPLPPLPTLPMQLMLTLGCWLSSPFALPCANGASPHSKEVPNPKESPLRAAVAEEAQNRANNFLSGIQRYVGTPYERGTPEPPAIWQRGNARVLDYGAGAGGEPVLFIPSLINRYYILDLEEERSMLRYLARQGVYPLVLDWGAPGDYEAKFGSGDYVTEILLPAIEFISSAAGGPITLAGYCMGGVLATAAAQLQPDKVGALALLATPWDFACKAFSPFVLDKQWLPMIESMIAGQRLLPPDVIQSLFYLTDPFVFEQKFRRFAQASPGSREARDFVALERWVNDGVPMTAATAHDCLIGWAQQNALAKGMWQVAGEKIDPKKITQPTFVAMPKSDHIVPLDCAKPLADAIAHAQVIRPSAGHVGMIVGSHAKKELWQPLVQWLFRSAA